jgi:hypothetical protein
MPVYKIIFTNDARATLGVQDEPQDFTYWIDAASADEALGLAEVEFKQKHPQKLRNYYRAHVATDHADVSERVQHFDRTAPLNPDQ